MNTDQIIGLSLTTLSYVVGALAFYRFSRGRGFKPRQLSIILFAALSGGIFGAKGSSLVIAVLNGTPPQALLAHPDGRTIMGGVLFGWLAVEFAKDRLKIKDSTGDGFAFALSLGEAIGRLGCYFNGCCYGIASSVPWAIYQGGALRHPTQIYSAIFAFGVFLLLCFLKNKVKYEGDLFRIYLLCFGLGRFFIEFLRVRSEVHFGLSIAQWVSLEIVIAMILAMVWTYRRKDESSQEASAHETL